MKITIDSKDGRYKVLIALIIISYSIVCFFPGRAELGLKTTQSDDVRRIDYVDENGTVVFNGFKGYASILQQLDEKKNVIEEYYLDEFNNPVAQSAGHYGRKHTYNSRNEDVLTTYIDQNGSAMKISYGYNSVRREYNEYGQNVKELYYVDNEQIILKSGEAGIYKEYDNHGRNYLITYLDLSGMPVAISAGYSSLRRSFNDAGFIEYEFYLDLDMEPVQAINGAYGLHSEYNDKGQRVSITYVDSRNMPTLNSSGYSIVRFYYDALGRICEERFFDTTGVPVSIGRGQYGVKRIYENNRLIHSVPIGTNGQELFFVDVFLSEHPFIVIIGMIILLIIICHRDRKLKVLLLFLYILFIMYMTIFARFGNISKQSFVFFGSYRQIFSSSSVRIEILENILLFIPLGTMLKSIWSKNKKIYWFALLPVLIELMQLFFNLGEFQFDDIVSNSIGLCIGVLFISLFQNHKKECSCDLKYLL